MAGWIPADELRKLQKRMNRLIEELGLDDLMEDVENKEEEWSVIKPLADVHETEAELVITMDLPGVDKKDIDITVSDDELHVVAERMCEAEVAEKNYHRRERTYKKFERRVLLPVGVRMDEAKARLAEGVLEVTLPKVVIASRKRISIE